MSEPRLISPLLDGFIMGDPISEHHGIYCCPAIKEGTDDKYIVKVISVPASATQMDALLLSGAYKDEASVLAYYKDLADETIAEVELLKRLSEQDGYIPYDSWQLEPMEDGKGYDIYLLRSYNRTLDRHFKRHAFTHLDALNLGLDLCAAMSVSRRSGYLYVGLKPGNIFVTEQGQYKIGGLGFIRLDSLKYMSLPEKCRSIYTPAEINDAYAALNATIDTYAVGLILYQAYNNGELPFHSDIHPGSKLPAPLYADYEMSEIILKACDPNPESRWQDPAQMGQAIVAYMQRNGAKDTPIVPVSVPEVSEEASETECSEDTAAPESTPGEELQESAEQSAFTEDEFGNLSFLSDVTIEDLGLTGDSEDYETLTGEVSEILNQADELATLSVPEPVTIPEHIDLPELEPPAPEQEPDIPEEDAQSTQIVDDEIAPEEIEIPVSIEEDTETEDEPYVEEIKKPHWLRNSIILLLLLSVLALGYFLYRQYYVIMIDSVKIEGSEDSLIVYIETEADHSLLQVICVDTYGNQIPMQVVDGKAEFTDLVPSTAYSIKVTSKGQHKVVGVGTLTYSTPVQTNIVHFDAVTDATDGSVILNFTVDGPDSKEWTVVYFAEDEDERSVTVSAHRVSLSGLTIGKEYTFRLVPTDKLYLTGQIETCFTVRKIVKAVDLEIISCMNNQLVVKWSAPVGENVDSWTVSCSGGTYNQTVTTTDTTYTFTGLDHLTNFTVDVKANAMSVGEKVSIPTNSVTATNLKADTSTPESLKITWDTSLSVPVKLYYTIDGIEQKTEVPCTENTADISPMIPDATYRIWLTDANGVALLGGKLDVKTPSNPDFAQAFGDATLTREDLEFQMCKADALKNWDGKNIKDLEFVETFASGENGAFLVRNKKDDLLLTDTPVIIMYVIRNQDGTPIYISTGSSTAIQMWQTEYLTLQMPPMPTATGTYSIDVYFNCGFASNHTFTIS